MEQHQGRITDPARQIIRLLIIMYPLRFMATASRAPLRYHHGQLTS
jgi:hypothetical protein